MDKIDAHCIDERGTEAVVTLDLETVETVEELESVLADELYRWIYMHGTGFDTINFVVTNWNEILEELGIMPEEEE